MPNNKIDKHIRDFLWNHAYYLVYCLYRIGVYEYDHDHYDHISLISYILSSIFTLLLTYQFSKYSQNNLRAIRNAIELGNAQQQQQQQIPMANFPELPNIRNRTR